MTKKQDSKVFIFTFIAVGVGFGTIGMYVFSQLEVLSSELINLVLLVFVIVLIPCILLVYMMKPEKEIKQ